MMPLSFAALISGMMTLVATAPNLVVNAELRPPGRGGLPLLQLHAVRRCRCWSLGIALHAVRAALAGRDGRRAAPARRRRPRLRDWIEEYRLAEREHRVRVDDRLAAGRASTLEELRAARRSGRQPAGDRARRPLRARDRSARRRRRELQAGDVLLVDLFVPGRRRSRRCARATGSSCCRSRGRPTSPTGRRRSAWSRSSCPADSKLVGQTRARGAGSARDYGLTVIGLRRGQSVHGRRPRSTSELQGRRHAAPGRLLDRHPASCRRPRATWSCSTCRPSWTRCCRRPSRAPQALLCLALVVGLMVSGVVPNVQAALIGCLLMGLLRLRRLHQRLPLDPLDRA